VIPLLSSFLREWGRRLLKAVPFRAGGYGKKENRQKKGWGKIKNGGGEIDPQPRFFVGV
jgi:hypothetical protein